MKKDIIIPMDINLDKTLMQMIKTLQKKGGFTVAQIADVMGISQEEVSHVMKLSDKKIENLYSIL